MRAYRTQSRNGASAPDAFTLIELLVVMAVLALMSSLVLVGLASASETARVNRTRSQIQKIHELLMSRYEEYRYRRVEPSTSGNVRQKQGDRVDKIRELMRMEMPDRISDLDDAPVSLSARPTLNLRYRRAVANRTGSADFATALAQWSQDHESSECLYMILESIQDGETNGIDFLKQSEVGDTDGDGVPEVLDAWGQPILFIRWPFGFPQIQTTGNFRFGQSTLLDFSEPDPFDPLNVRGGRTPGASTTSTQFAHPALFPLVFSAGPDGVYNVVVDIGVDYSTTSPPNNPYVELTGPPVQRVGQIADESGGDLDNITNHVLYIAGNDA